MRPALLQGSLVYCSGCLDLDLLRQGLGLLWHRNGQHTVGESGGGLLAVHAVGQREGALEFSIAALGKMITGLLLLLVLALFTPDRERVARQLHLNVLFGHPRKFGTQLERCLVLGNIDGGETDAERWFGA
jgi:hypothetical protein